MAVRCDFIDIIVPIANIDRVYPGAWLEFDPERACVYLKDAASEPVVGRESFEFSSLS
jgi:hypothetical protein